MMQSSNLLVAAILLTLAPTGISGANSCVSVSNCTTLNLRNCYAYNDTIDLDLSGFCIPCGQRIMIEACSTDNKCFIVGKPEYKQTSIRIRIVSPFSLEIAYTLQIWQVGGPPILETSPFLVSNSVCCTFCRGPEQFIIDTPLESRYEYGDTLTFKYRALCFKPNEKILVYVHSKETTNVGLVETLSTNVICGVVTIRIVGPRFVRGGHYGVYICKFPMTLNQSFFKVN